MRKGYLMLLLALPPLYLGCAGSSSQQETVAAPDTTGSECGGRYRIDVRNETYQSVDVYYMQTKLATGERAGAVNPRDTRTFFLRVPALWEVWAQLDGQRILVRDRPSQQRYRVYLTVACDTT
jgi:hypothetical protein